MPRRQAISRGALGVLGATLGAAAFLAARGELRGYLETFAYNVHYSSARTQADGPVGRMLEHLRIASDFFISRGAGSWRRPSCSSRSSVSPRPTSSSLEHPGRSAPSPQPRSCARRGARRRGTDRLLVRAPTAAGIPGDAHDSRADRRTDASLGGRWEPGCERGCRLRAVVVAQGAVRHGRLEPVDVARRQPRGDRARARSSAVCPRRAIDRLHGFGSNSESGHAAFVDDAFDLRCRFFHLYPLSLPEQYDETMRCAEREHPTLRPRDARLLRAVRRLPGVERLQGGCEAFLEREYELVEREHPGVQVWRLGQG